MNRKEYLKTWNAYPLWKTSEFSPLGRFISLSSQAGEQILCVDLNRENIEFFLPSELSEVWREILSAGDWIGLTLTSENQVCEIEMLAPNLAAAALEVNSLSHTKVARLQLWSRFQSEVRGFFESREFLHIDTPTLVPCPGYELHLEPFQTEFFFGARREQLFLPTSPEFHLKKALAMGLPRIFEIKKVFRNAESSDTHSPEFTMIEWYRAGSSLDEILSDTQKLIMALAKTLFDTRESIMLTAKTLNSSQIIEFETKTFREIFLTEFNYVLHPDLNFSDLKQLCERCELSIPDGSTADDLFHLLWIEILEPKLPFDVVVCVRDFPRSQAALAQLNAEGFADRFEIYFRGMELANAFQELNDPAVQIERFESEVRERMKLGRSNVGRDDAFFASLKSGLPPSAGIALGLDRLFMALSGSTKISELSLFPFL